MSRARPKLAFISPVFLFPADTGGRIRTTNVLRGLKGGAFEVTLVAPADAAQQVRWATQITTLCDRFMPWEPAPPRPRWRRAIDLLGNLPVNVAADRTRQALDAVRVALADGGFDVAVFDFAHAAVLRPKHIDAATVCFTHNVEAEIFERHATQARNVAMRSVWRSQARKMQRFEATMLPQFTAVVAVSERDASAFRQRCGIAAPSVIPTGVDLDYFASQPKASDPAAPTLVFTGSMDWAANIDGITYFLQAIWPLVIARVPQARFTVVGRNPPPALVERGRAAGGVSFTGLVDDVRPFVRSADVFVIPLRVGGGTRIKAYEAIAMGRPVVSTAVGIEGLSLQSDEHFLQRDDAAGFADAVVELLRDPVRAAEMAQRARRFVEARFGHEAVAAVFERACLQALDIHRMRVVSAPQVAPVMS